jgi:hypothetical protein
MRKAAIDHPVPQDPLAPQPDLFALHVLVVRAAGKHRMSTQVQANHSGRCGQ